MRALSNRIFCLLMALHVLNFSVDPPDTHLYVTLSGEVKEDLSVNEMESIAEWTLEHLLNLTNAVPEHDDADQVHPIKAFFYWVAPDTLLSFLLPPIIAVYQPVQFIFRTPAVRFPYAEVLSPPPWHA